MKKHLLRALAAGLLKTIILVFSIIYVIDVWLNMQYTISLLPTSTLWSTVPLIFVFFCIVVFVLQIIYKNKTQTESNNVSSEMTALSKAFFDIAWIAPLNLCAWLCLTTNQLICLYIGLAISLLLLLITASYIFYLAVLHNKKDE